MNSMQIAKLHKRWSRGGPITRRVKTTDVRMGELPELPAWASTSEQVRLGESPSGPKDCFSGHLNPASPQGRLLDRLVDAVMPGALAGALPMGGSLEHGREGARSCADVPLISMGLPR